MDEPPKKQLRGFALMSPEQRREISSRGGLSAHRQGKAHEWTKVTAREAGLKGGAASSRKRRSQT